ncbi:Protein kinase, ATP binding site-containing protein [Artemisia annua]|uniref:non-specific serine/threonine protein kinase n=1 Tax=Artemisia annua TaxID=35608 RepID=A0A2U1LB86_ARTAN|nr:Protein kinase, ATP binding site-containing protein [Artemisia annua]
MSLSGLNLEKFLIPLEEIKLATKNFSPENNIGDGSFGSVFKGQLSERWDNRIAAFKRHDLEGFQGEEQFRNEVEMIQPHVSESVAGTRFYMDPIYEKSGNLMVESDAYSFGVVLFEMLTGLLAYRRRRIGDEKPQFLINMVQHYHEDGVDKLIDPYIRDQIDSRSLDMFTEIAYKCINLDLKDRPKMDMIINFIEKTFGTQELKVDASTINTKSSHQFRDFEKFLIPLEEIMRATNNFSLENLISKEEHGSVICEGQLSEHWRNLKVAIYRFQPNAYQVEHKFIHLLKTESDSNHENIIPFIGYCNEGDERIVVFGHPLHGSLDDHLQDPRMRRCITWEQRLKICVGAAKGLNYFHVGLGKDRQMIHGDFMSHMILLDENMEAKALEISHVEKDVGFQFYLDPMYYETGIKGKKSDIYSFGVVMFEMLSGMMVHYERGIGDDKPQTLINLVRQYYENGLEKLIDPCISGQINGHSFHTFTEIAYKCISFNLKERPKMDTIIKQIEEALDIQNRRAASPVTMQSHQYQIIISSSNEIHLATRNFNPKAQIGDGEFSLVYRGKLPEPWKNKRFGRNDYKGEEEFHNELKMISRFEHENIIPFVGYCNEGNEMIIVSEYATNGSLDHHLQDPWKSRHLTWAQRLMICLGAAKAIKYLHSGHKEHCMIIHRDINSSNILLDDKLEAKICGFSLSVQVPENQQHTKIHTNVAGTPSYVDPIHIESGILSTTSDVYSFGIVLFEMLSGMLVFYEKSIGDDKPGNLINLVWRYYDDGPEKLIDPHINDHIDRRSFHKFIDIAYRCISFNLKDRLTMDRIILWIEKALDIQNHGAASIVPIQSYHDQNLKKFRIPLEEIRLAIGVKSIESQIGDGGFGLVYKGKLSELWQNRTAAIKYHDPKGYQGKDEFRNELQMISIFHYENIIPFIGYCDEGNEMIIVSEYATNGSLDHYLRDLKKRRSLTWVQRLNICLGAAKGLNYLHSGLGDYNRVVHRYVKSANILLDDNLTAKIGDFGLSRSGPRNQPQTQLYTKAAGTKFYIDPIYHESGILRKESDVYSFGVVLFEALSGMLAYDRRRIGDDNPQPLINLVRRYYEEGPDKLIDHLIKIKLITVLLKLHYLQSNERPTMQTLIERIEDALAYQVAKDSEVKEPEAKITEN